MWIVRQRRVYRRDAMLMILCRARVASVEPDLTGFRDQRRDNASDPCRGRHQIGRVKSPNNASSIKYVSVALATKIGRREGSLIRACASPTTLFNWPFPLVIHVKCTQLPLPIRTRRPALSMAPLRLGLRRMMNAQDGTSQPTLAECLCMLIFAGYLAVL